MEHTQSELDSLLQHVSDTWQLKRSLEQIQAQKHQLQDELNQLMTQELSIKKQLRESKKIIDHCLQTGEDATATKLVKSTQDLSKWQHDLDDLIYNSLYPAVAGAMGVKGVLSP